MNLPDAVDLNRLAAPRWVFNFGMTISGAGQTGTQYPVSVSPPAQTHPDLDGDTTAGQLAVFGSQSSVRTRIAAQRLDARQFGDAFSTLALIDRQSKGRAAGDAWQTLDRLLWFLCDPSAVRLP